MQLPDRPMGVSSHHWCLFSAPPSQACVFPTVCEKTNSPLYPISAWKTKQTATHWVLHSYVTSSSAAVEPWTWTAFHSNHPTHAYSSYVYNIHLRRNMWCVLTLRGIIQRRLLKHEDQSEAVVSTLCHDATGKRNKTWQVVFVRPVIHGQEYSWVIRKEKCDWPDMDNTIREAIQQGMTGYCFTRKQVFSEDANNNEPFGQSET